MVLSYNVFMFYSSHTQILKISSAFLASCIFSLSYGSSLEESFDAPLGGLPANWTISYQSNDSNNITEIENFGSGLTGLRMTRTASNGNSAIFYTGSSGPFGTGGNIADFSASIIIQKATTVDDSVGLYGRSQKLEWGGANTDLFQGYYAYLQQDRLGIVRDVERNAIDPTDADEILATTVFPNGGADFSNNQDYLFNFSIFGDNITVSLYEWNTASSTVGDLIATATATDSTYSDGYFGIASRFGGNNRTVYWRDLTVIPEPRSVAAISAGITFFLVLLIRRRMSN